MEKFTNEHLVPQLGFIATGHGEVMEQVISRQTAKSEDPLACHSVLDDAICQLQKQMWRCRVVVPKLSIRYREQETYRIVKGDEEITVYNAKKQRIAQSTFMDDSDDEAPCTKRTQQRKRHRSLDFLIESSCEEEEDTASSESPKPLPFLNREVSNEFRPSSWITDVIPRKSPFVPQMGDEVIYFRQGHEAYVDAVCRNNLYPINLDKQPWKKMDLRDQEFVKITGIKYEVCPPTLCCLKLTQIDPGTGKITNKSFSVKYHDMPYVIDFLVLRQNYDKAHSRIWKPNDHFRSVIDDAWWFGTIVCQEPYQPEYPDSHFQCIKVKWDNGEIEKLSPWDIEAIPENAQCPQAVGESVPVTDEERADILYKPQEDEWGGRSREDECARIIAGIDQLITVDIAAPFSGPVDLIQYPCTVIPYPTDLNTIRTRLKHNFYRRLSALIWETRYIYYNTRTFNEPRSKIAQSAKLITDVLLKFISKLHCTDIMEIYNAVENMEYTEDEDMQDDDALDMSTGRRTHQMELVQDRDAWKDACKHLLNYMFECKNCELFRQPLDQNEYQVYSETIDSPMDLETVRRNLEEDHYEKPTELCNDIRLIFANVKAFTPNKRSKIYSMTLQLSAFFEERIQKIISDYKTAVKTSLRHQRFRPPSPRGESTSQKRTAVKTQEQVEPPTTKSTSAKASPADRHRNKKRRRLSSTDSSMEDSNKSASSLSESENDDELSLSESKEEEFPSTFQPYRRETRATRRAMENRKEGKKNVTGKGSEINHGNLTGNDDDDDDDDDEDDFFGESSSLKRMQSRRAKSRNTCCDRVTRSAEKRKPDDSPHVSDEETETPKTEKHPHQNGRNIDTQDLNNFEKINHMTSKSQELESISKDPIAPKSQDEEYGKNEENESSSGEEKISPARKNKPRRPAKSQSLNSAFNASDKGETALNQRRKKKEDDSFEVWHQIDESETDKKTIFRTPSLRALHKKKYITDSEEDLDSEGEKQSWNGKRCSVLVQDCTKRCPQPSGESKRKHISTSESEDREENCKPSNKSGHGKHSRRKEKLFKSQEESSNEFSLVSQSSRRGCTKRSLRARKQGAARHKPSTSESENDNSCGKPWRATRIRTRNLGKQTVNYRDKYENDSDVSSSELEEEESPSSSQPYRHGTRVAWRAMQNRKERKKNDDSPHVTGHRKHSHEEGEDNSKEGETKNENCNKEEESNSRRKLIVVCEMKQINDVSEEEEENNCRSRRLRNHPSNANISKMSDEETETPKAEKPSDHPSDRKNEENESSSEEEAISNKKSSPARKLKPRRPARSHSLDSASNASESSDKRETALNQRRKKKEDDFSEEWRQSDELKKKKKTFSKGPSLRALPKKKYITDLNSEEEKQSWNGKRCFVLVQDCTKRCPQPSGESKRKHISTSESEERKGNCKPSDKSGHGKHSGRNEKLFKSQQESSNESSSGSQISPKGCTKRRIWARKQGAAHHKSSTSEPESDNSYGKLSRATRIRTRNGGKQTVNYRDITESESEVDHSTGNDDDDENDDEYSEMSNSLKRMQSKAKSRNTRVTRSAEKRKPDGSPHVTGHKKHSHEESEDNSNEGETENESCNEEEESNSRRKLIRKTTRAAMSEMKQINNVSEEEEENNCRSRRRRNHPSNANTSKMSDEETETPKAEKHPHQNRRKVDTQDLNNSEKIDHMMSKRQELESASKARIVPRALALKSGVKESSASRRKITSEDEEDGKNEENKSSSDMNKPRRPAKSQSLDSASNASDSSDESETALNQRRKKKEDDSAEEWRQSDESEKDKKTFSRRPSLRALPKKKYITDSEEDLDSEGEKQSWNIKRCSVSVQDCTKCRPQPSGELKRKHISTSESEDRKVNAGAQR